MWRSPPCWESQHKKRLWQFYGSWSKREARGRATREKNRWETCSRFCLLPPQGGLSRAPGIDLCPRPQIKTLENESPGLGMQTWEENGLRLWLQPPSGTALQELCPRSGVGRAAFLWEACQVKPWWWLMVRSEKPQIRVFQQRPTPHAKRSNICQGLCAVLDIPTVLLKQSWTLRSFSPHSPPPFPHHWRSACFL